MIFAVAGNTTATVTWSPPRRTGGKPISSYTVTSSPGSITATTNGTFATVSGLTNGTAYTFPVTATNSVGTSSASAASNSVTPPYNATLWTWGAVANGQLGLGDAVARSSPVQVGTMSTWSVIASQEGTDHWLALKADNTLWGWGNGSQGQLGQADIVSRSSPIQIGTLNTWTAMGGGQNRSFAVRSGTLWAWG